MMTAVPRATLIIANPTHFSIALKYVREEDSAPVVLAKGQDLVALKIREIAEANGIPIFEDVALARSMYKQVSVDSVIPPNSTRRSPNSCASSTRNKPQAQDRVMNRQPHASIPRNHRRQRDQGGGERTAPGRCRRLHRLHPDGAFRQRFRPRRFGGGTVLHAGNAAGSAMAARRMSAGPRAADRARPRTQAARRDRLFRAGADRRDTRPSTSTTWRSTGPIADPARTPPSWKRRWKSARIRKTEPLGSSVR